MVLAVQTFAGWLMTAVELKISACVDRYHGCNVLTNQLAVKEVNKSLIHLQVFFFTRFNWRMNRNT